MVMDISETDIQSFLTAVNNQDFGAIATSEFDPFLYQGFDPTKIVEAILKTKREKGISDGEASKDIAFICGISILAGAPREDQLEKRMTPEGKAKTVALAVKWGINWGGGRAKGPKYLTFPRVGLAFVITSLKIMGKVGAKDFPNDMLSNRLPDKIKHAGFPAVIPKSLPDTARRALLNVSLCYGIDMTISLQQIKTPDVKAIASKQTDYLRNSHASKIPSEPDRIAFFKTLKLEDNYKKIREVLETYKEKVNPEYEIPDESTFKQDLSKI